jgi:hypothetical protein
MRARRAAADRALPPGLAARDPILHLCDYAGDLHSVDPRAENAILGGANL